VLVAGAGALGSAIALDLARRGLRVTLADPAAMGDNASGAAAGMLAPAFEALLDPLDAGRFPLLAAARDLWPGFAGGLAAAMDLRRDGALWLPPPDGAPGAAERCRRDLASLGAAVELWPDPHRRVPGLAEGFGPVVFTPEDWRLAPGPALAALQAAARDFGARIAGAAVTGFEAGRVALSTGETVDADVLVVATGAEGANLAPELAALSPIKGQVLRFPGAAVAPGTPVLRGEAGYLAGGVDGLCVGATMEPGRADRAIDPMVTERQRTLAVSLWPALSEAEAAPAAGVRAASPDGLPLVGPSARSGVLVAAGARRNGWLLAPLVASLVGAYAAGDDPGPCARAMDARRFSAH
jgi:glycine oxidase